MFNLDNETDPNEFLPPGRSFRTNPLLVHSRVGRSARKIERKLPPSHVFGKVEVIVNDGAKQALTNWQTHVPKSHAEAGRDFVTLNRDAIKSGALSSRTVAEYRKQDNAKTATKGAKSPVQTARPTATERKSSSNAAAGVSSKGRPGTPIGAVLTGQYQHEWEARQRANMAQRWAKKKHQLVTRPTKASQGHTKPTTAR
ncbi:Cilia- and flagella-associated protein 77 [Plasmodiophora brassicae]|uniref:Uncharacterized protein n=1 Tax=Plasmodiophora brassicae TaxID=37360 RepID=A0A0G4IM96_PLABS|nr:hypothetical protein PBRA_004945 [Plasmodiophora brassicae]SPQ99209.1 unnamed protein product [Plasmodiophora brassicae]